MIEPPLYGALSPDLTRIAYESSDENLNFEIEIFDLGNHIVTEVPYGQDCQSPSWAPDGKMLAADCESGIWILPLQENTPVWVTNWVQSHEYHWDYPIWSPDGRWLAYFNRPDISETPSNGLYITDTSCLLDETTCQTKTMGPYQQSLHPPIAWSPDSRYLVTVLKTSISILDFQTGAYRELVKIEDGYYPEALAWSHDGEWIAYDIFGRDVFIVSAQGGDPVFLMRPEHGFRIMTWITISHPFAPGDVYAIASAGADLNLRAEPSLDGTVLTQLQPGDAVTILDGPVEADGYTWWKMSTEDGTEGWAVNIPEWYEPSNH